VADAESFAKKGQNERAGPIDDSVAQDRLSFESGRSRVPLIERGGRLSHRPTVNIGGMAPDVFALSPNKKFHRLRQRLLRSGVVYRQTPASVQMVQLARTRERERERERDHVKTRLVHRRACLRVHVETLAAGTFARFVVLRASGEDQRRFCLSDSVFRLLTESRGATWRGLTRDTRPRI